MSTTAIGAITAHHEAKRSDRSSAWPIALALTALPAGFGTLALIGSSTGDGVITVICALAVTFAFWYFAFNLAAPESEPSPLGRSFKYVILFAALFVAELVVGFFLIILYVVPYLIVAGLVSFFAISSHHKSQRNLGRSSMPPPPNWQPPPPPAAGTLPSRPTTLFAADQDGSTTLGLGDGTSGPPAAWPPRSDYQADVTDTPVGSGFVVPTPPTSDVGGFEPPAPDDSTGFEPPANYQLPGYPAAPPQADGPALPGGTYRPGNPASQPPPLPPTDPPPDEQA